jgi:hypothetical protein
MDFDRPPEDDPRRLMLRAGLDADPHPTGRQLAAAGWHCGFLFAPALTLGGGTFAVQRKFVAEMVLGLPRDPGPA